VEITGEFIFFKELLNSPLGQTLFKSRDDNVLNEARELTQGSRYGKNSFQKWDIKYYISPGSELNGDEKVN